MEQNDFGLLNKFEKKKYIVKQLVELLSNGITNRKELSEFIRSIADVGDKTVSNYIKDALRVYGDSVVLKDKEKIKNHVVNGYLRLEEIGYRIKDYDLVLKAYTQITKFLKLDEDSYFKEEKKKTKRAHAKSLDEIERRLNRKDI